MPATFDASEFGAQWNRMDRSQRRYLRRLVRMGRRVEDPELAHLAPAYARWQLQRPWMRFFWLWFVPGILLGLGVTSQIHPILVGVTIALGAQAVFAYMNLRKLARAAR